MSLKSDKWIMRQNNKPTHILLDKTGVADRVVSPPYTAYEKQVIEGGIIKIPGSNSLSRRHVARNIDDWPIGQDILKKWVPMIEGAVDQPVRYVHKETGEPIFLEVGEEPTDDARKIISYGVSSYGYDVRLAGNIDHIKVFTNVFAPEIDPKRMKTENFATPTVKVDEDGANYVLIPPHSYLQGPTMEYFNIPRDVLVIVLGKSTYARSALICNVTPIEPEFSGEVVIEVANTTSSPVRCYLEEGIAQFVFFQGDEACLRSYKDKFGKYQGQRGLTFAKV